MAETLWVCDKDLNSNIHRVVKIAVTKPVTLCEYERSFGGLRRLNTHLRATQTSLRLDSLASMKELAIGYCVYVSIYTINDVLHYPTILFGSLYYFYNIFILSTIYFSIPQKTATSWQRSTNTLHICKRRSKMLRFKFPIFLSFIHQFQI